MNELFTNAMTIDVEDYYQVGAFEKVISRDDWGKYPSRVARNTDILLELFRERGVKATFFSLSCVAEKNPNIIRRIVQEGHEIASHGTDHKRVTELSRAEFLEDLSASRKILEDIAGEKVIGYRAPSFSFTSDNSWVYECLAKAGYKYSSSVYPVKHDHYGIPEAPRFAYDGGAGVREIPLCTLSFFGKNLPISGGGFFRLYPYMLMELLVKRFNKGTGRPYIFYLHPWEVDADQPVIEEASAKSKFRHYLNLGKTQHRLQELARAFEWRSMKDVFKVE